LERIIPCRIEEIERRDSHHKQTPQRTRNQRTRNCLMQGEGKFVRLVKLGYIGSGRNSSGESDVSNRRKGVGIWGHLAAYNSYPNAPGKEERTKHSRKGGESVTSTETPEITCTAKNTQMNGSQK